MPFSCWHSLAITSQLWHICHTSGYFQKDLANRWTELPVSSGLGLFFLQCQSNSKWNYPFKTVSRLNYLLAANESYTDTHQASCLFATLEISVLEADKKAFKSVHCWLQEMIKLQLPHIFQLNQSRKLPSWWPELQEGQFCMKNLHLPKQIYSACGILHGDHGELGLQSWTSAFTLSVRQKNCVSACQTPLPTRRVPAISV